MPEIASRLCRRLASRARASSIQAGHHLRIALRMLCHFAAAVGLATLTHCGDTEVLGSQPPSSCDFAEYDPTSSVTMPEIKIATFWQNSAEHTAFQVLSQSARSRGYTVAKTGLEDRNDQQTSLRDWFEHDSDPLPDAFQVNGGSDLLRWVVGEEPQVCPLDRLDTRYQFRKRFFEAALQPSTCKNIVYGVPVGVHRLNVAFYNTALLDQLMGMANDQGKDLGPPEGVNGVREFIEHLSTIATLGAKAPSGAPIVPLAVANDATWPFTILAFENLMVARGNGLYEAIWMGRPEGQTAEALEGKLMRWLEDVRDIAKTSNLERPVSWEQAIKMVAEGEAVYTVMGDWVWAQLNAEQRGVVSSLPFPGTERAFVYTPDSFAVPRRRGTDGSGAHAWLMDVVSDTQTQMDFSNAKHSIPALRDLDADVLDHPHLREGYREFTRCQEPDSSCRLLLAVSGLGPPPALDPCLDNIAILLSRVAGTMQEPTPDVIAHLESGACALSVPEGDSAAASDMLIRQLLGVSDDWFAAPCR